MGCKDVGSAIESVGRDIGNGFVTAGKTVYYEAKTVGEAVANVVTHPDQVFSSVSVRDDTHTSTRSSAVPAPPGLLKGLDLALVVRESTLNRALADAWGAGQLGFATGPAHFGGPMPELFEMEGDWGAPSLGLNDPSATGRSLLHVGLQGVRLSWLIRPRPPVYDEITADHLRLDFEVILDLSTYASDTSDPAALPEGVRDSLAGRTDLSIQRLVANLQDARLSTLHHVDTDARLTDGQLGAVQDNLQDYFRSLPPGAGVLGYTATGGGDPGGAGILRPSAVSLSSSVAGSEPSLIYPMMTGGRRLEGPTAQVGRFAVDLIPADWGAGMVVSSRIYVGEVVEKGVLDVVAASVGRGAGFEWHADQQRWVLDWGRDYSGTKAESGDINDIYADGHEAVNVTASLRSSGLDVVLTLSGASTWERTLWARPLGNRQDIGTTRATVTWSLTVQFTAGTDGRIVARGAPAVVTTDHSERQGDLGEFLSLYTSAVGNMQREMSAVAVRMQTIAVQQGVSTVLAGLETASGSFMLPGGQSLVFDGLALDRELDLLIRAHYAPVVAVARPPATPRRDPVNVPADGGPGEAFDDLPIAGSPISAVRVRHGEIIDAIGARYGVADGPEHGGSGGGLSVFELDPQDPLVAVEGTVGRWYGAIHVLRLELRTRSGRRLGPVGTAAHGSDARPFSLEAGPGRTILALHGRTSAHSDRTRYLAALGLWVG